MTILTTTQRQAAGASFAVYLRLTKPRIAALLVFTALSTAVVAAGSLPPLRLMLGLLSGGWLAAAGASVLNQYLERDLDARMTRTRARPLPAGTIPPLNALLFGLMLLVWSAVILMMLVNVVAAALAIIGAVYYVGIYTLMLKQHTTLNVVIGGGAGAFPVLVGWAGAAGTLELGALLLFAIVFFWTPPHSWALALLIQGDYERGTVPMMPVVYGAEVTRAHIIWYSAHLFVLTLLVYAVGLMGGIYLVTALVLGGGLIWYSVRIVQDTSRAAARRLYKYSSLYLLLLFLAMILDVLL